MKADNNNEMDLLLRAVARKAQPASAFEADEAGHHLDADQLNCFAEGIVSGAERARYVRHLADCQLCRRQVANLVPVGIVGRAENTPAQPAASFLQKLNAFMSPAFLRFALPALVLASVFGIVMLAMRQQKQTEFIAQNQTTSDNASSKTAATSEPGNLTPAAPGSSPTKTENPNLQVQAERQNGALKPGTSDQPAPATDNPTNASGRVPAEEAPLNKTEAIAQPTTAADAAAAPPPAAPKELDDAKKAAVLSRAQQESELQKRREDSFTRMAETNETDRVSGPRKGPSRGGSIAGLSNTTTTRDKDQRSNDEAETRRLSGKTFRREGNVWVDTSYTGRSTISVIRGSEQYRALIADEPGLGAIASQFSGEVIVVWKGTPYRIY